MAALNADGPRAALEVGNAVWAADRFRPRAQYPDTARETCLAAAERADLAAEDEDGGKEGAERVNGWAEAATRGKIPAVLNEADVDGDTATVLTDAVHFKGTRLARFREEDAERRRSAWAAQAAPVPTS